MSNSPPLLNVHSSIALRPISILASRARPHPSCLQPTHHSADPTCTHQKILPISSLYNLRQCLSR
ncbi:hypothetical protein WG66_004648 [Moniliophthora roreri]|nr:hypothetical protein WG66_004648 [Moniliophthora roreri]